MAWRANQIETAKVGLEEQHRFRPNQGIWRSARNAGIFALMSLPVVVILAITVFLIEGAGWGGLGPLPPPPLLVIIWPYFTLLTMLFIFLLLPLIVLRIGGAAALQHLVLRVFLWRCGLIPWNYPRFLDDSVECILLRKVGGGYIFVHRFLLEYFAALDTAPPPADKAHT